ncbi:MAG: alpha-ketoglutarate dehydrogenase [Vulcanimicrobiaceae bacterium]
MQVNSSGTGLGNQAAADNDPDETREWAEALEGIVRVAGRDRACFLLDRLGERAHEMGVVSRQLPYSAYQNTIPLAEQGPYPGDLAIEERLTAILRWNALAMVVRANKAYGELGGHIASYASAAEIFETGFNHFFRGWSDDARGDLVFFQPHSAPGVYARAFLEGRLSEERLANFRREIGGNGLCSYPHPWLMPDFWQFPTGSMGLGSITSIYQARFMRYLQNRGLAQTGDRRVWGVFGDGEMDEPESIAALTLAAREQLDNLTFVINCNLQRLDGPVRGNGQIIQELDALFTGAGWNVIKVLWGSEWDALFARDATHALLREFASTVDGAYQTLGANDGRYNREHFFEVNDDLRAIAGSMTPAEIDALKRGGHDLRKLHAAFAAAVAHKGRPTVILAKTKKGFGISVAESRMTAHQHKKLDIDALRAMRDRFNLPLDDDALAEMRFYRPPDGSAESDYLLERRRKLGGALPARPRDVHAVAVPARETYAAFATAANGKEMSTTMAAVRLLNHLVREKDFGARVVPIVADEARTFGMDNLFRQVGIYSAVGQRYEPEDAGSMLYYREAIDGQLLEEGITEAGALSSWIAAATSYSVHGVPLLPFYVFYSMFGFQRVGDLIWAAADQRARGFLVGATSGRTTLGGEGLQHQDGSSLLVASTVPTCRAYDPAFASELAVIVDYGARRMLEQRVDEFYYVTVTNESYAQPSLRPGVEDGIVRGMYLFATYPAEKPRAVVRLLGSGAILREVIAAAEMLGADWNVTAEVWSVTSFGELAREAQEVERWNRLHPQAPARESYVASCLAGTDCVVAATDYVRAYPQLIASHIDARLVALGTDGFGRSDTREALRRFFEVDRQHIVVAVLQALTRSSSVSAEDVAAAVRRYELDIDSQPSWQR